MALVDREVAQARLEAAQRAFPATGVLLLILIAKQLFPQAADGLTRKKDHGRADALLMAAWARRTSTIR